MMNEARRILSLINESPPADEQERGLTYYHGTPNWKAAQKIMREGIRPGSEISSKKSDDDWDDDDDDLLRPVADRVYITPNLHIALVYALGGDVAGSKERILPGDFDTPADRYGCVFEISGSSVNDIQPDEDIIGMLIHDKKYPWLNRLAEEECDGRDLKMVSYGEYKYWAKVGKELIPFLTVEQQHILMKDPKMNMAHKGAIKPVSAWKVDKCDTPKYKPDGSNFFEVAKKVR